MLRPMPIEPVPHETVRVPRAAFSKGNRYLRLADEVETLCTDDAFRALFPTHGQPAWPPWRLALATILQFADGLSDRQAAHAVRSRIDWKYVLRLELTNPKSVHRRLVHSCGNLCVFLGGDLLDCCGDGRLMVEL
jgi:transposase